MNNNSGKVGLPSQLYRCNFGFNEPHQPKSTIEFERHVLSSVFKFLFARHVLSEPVT